MSIWTWLGAVFPILFLFLMMSVFHMKTERAAFLGIICAMISAILIGKSTPQIVTTDLAKGAFSALNIQIVIKNTEKQTFIIQKKGYKNETFT